MARIKQRARTVGLDKPCRRCGKPIHYSYVGPIKGLCGQCADSRPAQSLRRYHRGMTVGPAPKRPMSKAAVALLIIVVCLAGTAAVAFGLGYLVP
ncbi:MAG: hypothetical protein ACYTGN_18530 [Planctomycetota bacterium]|jgi:hypothetical protein